MTHSTLPYFYPDNYLAKRCAKYYIKICSLSFRSPAIVCLICPLTLMSDQNSSSACFDFFPVFSIEILLEVLAKEYFKSNIEDHQDGI